MDSAYTLSTVVQLFSRIFVACVLLAGHVPALAFAQTPQCEMACCRKAANTSCHRSHTHSGPAWQATMCGSRCGGVQLGTATAMVSAVILQSVTVPEAVAVIIVSAVESGATRLITFSQFQRPPPLSLQL